MLPFSDRKPPGVGRGRGRGRDEGPGGRQPKGVGRGFDEGGARGSGGGRGRGGPGGKPGGNRGKWSLISFQNANIVCIPAVHFIQINPKLLYI